MNRPSGAEPEGFEETPEAVVRSLDHPVTLLLARILLTAPFLVSGIMKLVDWDGGEAEMVSVGLRPPWIFNLASLLTEIGGSVLVILNRKVWLGAGALAVFTGLTSFLAHRFWELTGAARAMQLNVFLEHGAICGAFVLVVVVVLRRRVP